MLVYDECDQRRTLGPDEFFLVSFDTVEAEDGEPEQLVRYTVHVFGDGSISYFEDGELRMLWPGIAPSPRTNGESTPDIGVKTPQPRFSGAFAGIQPRRSLPCDRVRATGPTRAPIPRSKQFSITGRGVELGPVGPRAARRTGP